MSLTLLEVEKIAHLARLELTAVQKSAYQEQLSAILDYAEMLNELDLTGIEPTAHAVAQRNVLRADVIEPSCHQKMFYLTLPSRHKTNF